VLAISTCATTHRLLKHAIANLPRCPRPPTDYVSRLPALVKQSRTAAVQGSMKHRVHAIREGLARCTLLATGVPSDSPRVGSGGEGMVFLDVDSNTTCKVLDRYALRLRVTDSAGQDRDHTAFLEGLVGLDTTALVRITAVGRSGLLPVLRCEMVEDVSAAPPPAHMLLALLRECHQHGRAVQT